MTRNQIIVVSACAVLCLGIYLFADTKKQKDEKTAEGGHNTMQTQEQPKPEALNIEAYIADVNAKSFAGIPQDLIEKEKSLKAEISLLTQKLVLKPDGKQEQDIPSPIS